MKRGQWVCNEKQLIEAAGLSHLQASFAQVPAEPASLLRWIDKGAERLKDARSDTNRDQSTRFDI